MNIFETLSNATLFAGSCWKAALAQGHEDEARLWRYMSESRHFVDVTGQSYHFEDYLKGLAPGAPSRTSPALTSDQGTFARPAAEMLLRVFDEVPEPEQKQHVRVLLALLDFIADTGQIAEAEGLFLDPHQYVPIALARFSSREEAEQWLKDTPEPPSPAKILIGDDYYRFWYMREDNTRNMYREYDNEATVAELTRKGIPPGAPSFSSRAEAEEWLKHHPANPKAFVVIAGEHYLAVHHKNLKLHTLTHVASALREFEEYKKRLAESEDEEDPPEDEGA